MLTLYLRPKAVFGVAALAISIYTNLSKIIQQQQHHQQQYQGRKEFASPTSNQSTHRIAHSDKNTTNIPRIHNSSQTQYNDAALPMDTLPNSILAVATWFLVAYTRCIPVLLLAICLSLSFTFVHASSRAAPSESRYKGKLPLSYSIWQVIGRESSNGDPRLLFKQILHGAVLTGIRYYTYARGWMQFYARSGMERLSRPFVGMTSSLIRMVGGRRGYDARSADGAIANSWN